MSAAAPHMDGLSPERLLTADEVAEILRVTTRTLRRWAHEGKIEHVRLAGYTLRFTPAQVEAVIQAERPQREGSAEQS